jgi:carbohydrate-binding DOMON domain-containing protein
MRSHGFINFRYRNLVVRLQKLPLRISAHPSEFSNSMMIIIILPRNVLSERKKNWKFLVLHVNSYPLPDI